ncbi:ATP-binding protein [Actinomyces wuliandei]|uniref:ATP-binding protein n=1 Tax=Actinomyces wuliandei TaxID=2057743 RepID=UPI0019D43A82|nr:ATP-binding protein [Actinomyces wuliandei]
MVLRGARATGKTESALQVAASTLRLDSASPRARLARASPETALAGDTPRLLDEWQLAPGLWNEVRHAVDQRRAPGQFVLTGSASPDDDPLRHSGAGRMHTLLLRTMTLAETRHSTGEVSLSSLLDGEELPLADSALGLPELVSRVVTGGWPGWFDLSERSARLRADSYVQDIVEHEFATVAGTRRDPRRFHAYLSALAGLVAQPASQAAVVRRMREEYVGSLGPTAPTALHDLAQRLFLVEDQPAWSPSLRSASAASQAPVRHLVDPSLAAVLLGAGSDRLMTDPQTLGFLFESQVVHDLRVYAQAAGARGVFHYRDTKGRDEIDAVVEGADGQWLAVEVKLGEGRVEEGAANLLRVTAKMTSPPLMCLVVVPTGVAHVRPDGVGVLPLTVLGA